jgi:hypothetical protein
MWLSKMSCGKVQQAEFPVAVVCSVTILCRTGFQND